MTNERAEIFRRHVDSKLLEQNVDVHDLDKAVAALSKCVLGSQLVAAYKLIYHAQGVKDEKHR